jgi:hypothetical protein
MDGETEYPGWLAPLLEADATWTPATRHVLDAVTGGGKVLALPAMSATTSTGFTAGASSAWLGSGLRWNSGTSASSTSVQPPPVVSS